jgi:nucleoside-diphosphate-sugar epimerase
VISERLCIGFPLIDCGAQRSEAIAHHLLQRLFVVGAVLRFRREVHRDRVVPNHRLGELDDLGHVLVDVAVERRDARVFHQAEISSANSSSSSVRHSSTISTIGRTRRA